MKRSTLRILLGGLFVAAIVALLLSLGSRKTLQAVLDPSMLTAEDLPELLQRIRSFHRVVTRGGLTVLEVSAEEASYYKNDRAVVIRKPRIVIYEQGERAASLAGDQGKLYLDGNDVESVELTGAVTLALERFQLSAENLAYDRRAQRIRILGPTRIDSPELQLSGTDLTLDMVQRTLTVGADVAMRVEGTEG